MSEQGLRARAVLDGLRIASVIGAFSVSPLLFFVGLIAPLTPSWGLPTTGALITCVGVPLTLILLAAVLVDSTAFRILLAVEAAAILAFEVFLLQMQGSF